MHAHEVVSGHCTFCPDVVLVEMLAKHFYFTFACRINACSSCMLLSFHSRAASSSNTHKAQKFHAGNDYDKDDGNDLNNALSLFNSMLLLHPLPSVVHFNQLLVKIARMKALFGSDYFA